MAIQPGQNTGGVMSHMDVGAHLDIEATMMMVSANRAQNLETQMKDQVNRVKERQNEIGALTRLLNDLSALIKGKSDDDDINMSGRAWQKELTNAGIPVQVTKSDESDYLKVLDKGNNFEAKKSTIEGWVERIKGSIDGLNSTGQLDMIRLQSIMNKRNEAFEQLTNMVQKFNKARESIVGNTR